MARNILHGKFRNPTCIQTKEQLILQGSITRIATAEREKEALTLIKASRAKLENLSAKQCLVSPSAMSNFLMGMMKLVDEAIARSKEQAALANIGVPPVVRVNGVTR